MQRLKEGRELLRPVSVGVLGQDMSPGGGADGARLFGGERPQLLGQFVAITDDEDLASGFEE
jgi:hypothetical protein